jgi:hypothetical protein
MQGDQIGRKFAQCVIVYSFQMTEIANIIRLFLNTRKVMH